MNRGIRWMGEMNNGTGKRDGWVKAPATKPDPLSLIPGLHMAEGGNQLLQVVL